MRLAALHPAPLTRRERRDLRTLGAFIALHCRHRHAGAPRRVFTVEDVDTQAIFGRRPLRLCRECEATLAHGVVKRLRCPLDPKPMCKDCPAPCYSEDHRARVRAAMRFSGPRMLLRGRLHYLWHLR